MSAYIGDKYKLPTALVGRADLARLVREVETIDGNLEQQKVRAGEHGAVSYSLPNMSQPLHDFLEQNEIDIADDQARMILKEQLRKLKDKAPIVHMTFATEADPASVQKLVAWLRENAHPQTLVSVGLQPSLIAGVYLRTPNQVHDFTLKALFSDKQVVMIKELETFAFGPQVVAAPPQNQLITQTLPDTLPATAPDVLQETPHG